MRTQSSCPDGKPGAEQTEAFGVYEDTEFLTSSKPAGGDQTLGFQVYEDTDFRIGREGLNLKGSLQVSWACRILDCVKLVGLCQELGLKRYVLQAAIYTT